MKFYVKVAKALYSYGHITFNSNLILSKMYLCFSRSFESKAFNVSQLDHSKRRNDFAEEQPVILFISSRLPAREVSHLNLSV